MCKEHDRSAGRAALEIGLKPLQLVVTERPHASSFQIGDIDETNEMHTLVIKAVPPTTLCTFSIALEILLAVVAEHVMLTRHKIDLFGGRSLQCLVKRVEFTRLRELAQIAGVNDEIRFVGQRVDLVDRPLQSCGDVGVSWLVKADVAVADLDKAEVPTF